MAYNNAVLTLTNHETPDPFMTAANGRFYLVFTAGDRIEIWEADTLADFEHRCNKQVIWKPPPGQPYSDGIWAPELHPIGDRWYVFFAGGHPAQGNKSHRMWVLAGPPIQQHPAAGPWDFAGPINGLPPDQWAIDGTAFELNGSLYFVYSGWPFGEHNSDLIQQLFIVQLAHPTKASSQPVMISKPEHGFEFSHDQNGAHGINEGPQWLSSPDGNWKGIVYSCAGSWTKDYKLNTLQYRGGDPLNPGSWHKGSRPLLQASTSSHGPYGPGHGNFLHFGNETLAIFHATDKETDGWANRKARVQRVKFDMHGPSMGDTVGIPVNNFDAFQKAEPPAQAQGSEHHHGLRAVMHDAKEKLRNM